MILALAATVAIVVQEHAMLRAAPRSTGIGLTALSQGDALEVRGEAAGYLQVYDYRRERGGYLKTDAARRVELTEAGAPDLLAVLRFLQDTPGSEALGISYGAAYLKAASARAPNAEPFDAIARMAERLGEQASASTGRAADVAARLDVVQQFGVRMRTFERAGRMQVCYDGELFRRVLTLGDATAEQRANAVLGLTRPDCIDPEPGPAARASLDDERRGLLETVGDADLSAMTRSRIHARRAAVLSSVAFEQARRGGQPGTVGAQAVAELLAVHPGDLGDDHRGEYLDAVLRVGAIRWAAARPAAQSGPFTLSAAAGEPGQTCITLHDARRADATVLVRRCTYGIAWMASVHAIASAPALVLAVQPLEAWRELWVFRQDSQGWTVDVIPPDDGDPDQGYVEFAGFAPGPRRILIAREVKLHGRFERQFEERSLESLALERQANSPEALRDFGRWQDPAWRRDSVALH